MNNCKPKCQTAHQNTQLRIQRQRTIDFLTTIAGESGMMLRPQIEKHIAELTGTAFSQADWNVADINGNQGV